MQNYARHDGGGYLVWVFETYKCEPDCVMTTKCLVPTDAEMQALPAYMGKVKQRMYGGCCCAVGSLVINRGPGGWKAALKAG
jgi:hypothetical protein